MAFYITGDCHRDFKKVEVFCNYHNTDKKDYMIVLGDAGINYFLDKADRKLKDKLSKLPIRFFMVHGNHEARPYELPSYREREWHGGSVYYEEEYPDLLFARDGDVYDFDGKKGIVIGGAYSVDKEFRIMAGMPWYASEQPSQEIRNYVEKQLRKYGWTVDYVFSHTCPRHLEPTDLFLDYINQDKVDKATENWLSELHGKLHYKKWYFGHFHGERVYYSAEMLYDTIKELGATDYLQKLGSPMYWMGIRVYFYRGNKEADGTITDINVYGTRENTKEITYQIDTFDGHRYCNIPESAIEKI